MPGRDNYIYREGTTANTRLLNTQRVRVFGYDAENSSGTGDFHQIGLVQSWNPSHSRSVEPHRGIGYGDQINNQGPVDIVSYDPLCGSLIREIIDVPEEALGFWHTSPDGRTMCVSGLDPKGPHMFGCIYINDGSGWQRDGRSAAGYPEARRYSRCRSTGFSAVWFCGHGFTA